MTELKINSTWQLVFYSNTNSLLCIQQQHSSHFSVTVTFICTVPLVQPLWFILSSPHFFKNTDNKKQWKYTWCFLFPCQYYPSQNVQNVHGMVCHKAVVQLTSQRGLNISRRQLASLKQWKGQCFGFFSSQDLFFQALLFCLIIF